jgi:hypothetical protein
MSNQQFEFAADPTLVSDCSPYKRHPFCTSRYRRTIPSLYILTVKFSIDNMRFHQRFDGNSRRNQRGASNNGHAPNQVYLGASRIAGREFMRRNTRALIFFRSQTRVDT